MPFLEFTLIFSLSEESFDFLLVPSNSGEESEDSVGILLFKDDAASDPIDLDSDSMDFVLLSAPEAEEISKHITAKASSDIGSVVNRKRRFYEHLSEKDQLRLFQRIYELLESASPQAAERRRSDALHVIGTSIPKIKEDLMVSLKDLMDRLAEVNIRVDDNCLRHLFLPPHKKHRAAVRYWGVINARIAHGENSLHIHHPWVISLSVFVLCRDLTSFAS
jgi:hypothetical protein